MDSKKELPVTRQSPKNGDIQVTLQLPQDAIPMGVLIPISYGEDHEFQEKIEALRLAVAEQECLEVNIQAIEQSVSILRKEAQMSHDRVVSARREVDEYLAKHLNKEHRRDQQRTE